MSVRYITHDSCATSVVPPFNTFHGIGTHDSGIPCILPICGIIARRRSGANTSRSRDFDTGAVRYSQWGIP